MNRLFSKHRHTLSGKLVMLFIAMALLTAAVLIATLGWAFRDHFESEIRPHLQLYMEFLQNELGDPPQQSKAQTLANRLGLEIHYLGPQPWSTHGSPLSLDDVQLKHTFTVSGKKYSIGHNRHNEYLVSHHDHYPLVLAIAQQRALWHKVAVVGLILLLLLLATQEQLI